MDGLLERVTKVDLDKVALDRWITGNYSEDQFGEEEPACPACGEFISYCQGHGTIGDPAGAAILIAHDAGDHSNCDEVGCEYADGFRG